MFSEYILFGFALPIVIIFGVKIENRIGNKQLLDKNDTSVLRGISAFFVISAHYMVWVDEIVGNTNIFMKLIVGQLGGIGVLVFFFVSGYGLYESYGDKRINYVYIIKRLKSVYFPYILMKFLMLLCELLLGYRVENIGKSIISILLVEDWFIHVILIQYIVFYVAKKISNKYVVLISIIVDIGLTIMYIYLGRPIGWFNALWLFTFGLVVSKIQPLVIDSIEKKYKLSLGLCFLLFVIIGLLFAVNKGQLWANILKPLSGVFLCLLICILMRKIRFGNAIIGWAGKRSMHLYIVHIFMWNILLEVQNPIYRLWLAICLTIIGTEMIYRITLWVSEKVFGGVKAKNDRR